MGAHRRSNGVREGSAGVNGQCARVLDVLSDGEKHTVREIHERAGTMRLNSRVSELRRRLKREGSTIICTKVAGLPGPDAYEYQLVPLDTAETGSSAAASGTDGFGVALPREAGQAAVPPLPPLPLTDAERDALRYELEEMRERRVEIAENLAANPHLDQDNARDTLMRTERAIARLEEML